MSWFESIAIHTYNRLSNIGYRASQRHNPTPTPEDALILGTGSHPHHTNRRIQVFISPEHRARHLYIIGGTGSGKTKQLENLIRQDILAGRGTGVIDCHGDLVKSTIRFLSAILSDMAATNNSEYDSLLKKIVIFDPTIGLYAAGFNPLETTPGLEPYGQALELINVFSKLWDCSGPRVGEMLRNTLVTLAEHGLTLLEVQPFLTDNSFREGLIRNLSNSEVRRYWIERFNTLSGAMKGQYIEPVLNKVGAFVTDPNIRAIVGQQKSTINLREIMDSGKILLVNISKGFLKGNSQLLGALLLAKIQDAAMSRANIPENSRRPWYLYVDEFQNFATDSFDEILSESRKYKLSLVMANQGLSQLPLSLRSSIKSNVGTQMVFRVSQDDAMELASEILPQQKTRITSMLINQGTAQALVNIKGQHPVEIRVPHISEPRYNQDVLKLIYRESIKRYARSRSDVEADITRRRQTGNIKQGSDNAKHNTGKDKAVSASEAPFSPKGEFKEGK